MARTHAGAAIPRALASQNMVCEGCDYRSLINGGRSIFVGHLVMKITETTIKHNENLTLAHTATEQPRAANPRGECESAARVCSQRENGK